MYIISAAAYRRRSHARRIYMKYGGLHRILTFSNGRFPWEYVTFHIVPCFVTVSSGFEYFILLYIYIFFVSITRGSPKCVSRKNGETNRVHYIIKLYITVCGCAKNETATLSGYSHTLVYRVNIIYIYILYTSANHIGCA